MYRGITPINMCSVYQLAKHLFGRLMFHGREGEVPVISSRPIEVLIILAHLLPGVKPKPQRVCTWHLWTSPLEGLLFMSPLHSSPFCSFVISSLASHLPLLQAAIFCGEHVTHLACFSSFFLFLIVFLCGPFSCWFIRPDDPTHQAELSGRMQL